MIQELECTKQVMHNALLTTHQSMPSQFLSHGPWPGFPLAYVLDMKPYGMECPFGQFGHLSWPGSLPAFCAAPPWQSMRH